VSGRQRWRVTSRVPHDYTKNYPLALLEPHLDQRTMARLKTRVGSSPLSVVGLWPDDAVSKKYDMIIGGENLLFVSKTHLVAGGTVIYSKRSRPLAEALYGKGAQSMNELLVFLVGVQPFGYTLAQFYDAIGRKTKAPFKAFTTLSTPNIQHIEQKFGSIYSFFEEAKPRETSAAPVPAPAPEAKPNS
jgi:hypothetical protein